MEPGSNYSIVPALLLLSISGLFVLYLVVPFLDMSHIERGIPCGMSHTSEVCPLAMSEYVDFWRMSVLPSPLRVIILGMFISFLGVVSWRVKLRHYTASLSPPMISYLQRAFAAGVLNPKVY